jgi:hypothetical protein
MKTEMRRSLARQPFEEKIRKVAQLMKLSATAKSSRVHEGARIYLRPGPSLPAVAGNPQSMEPQPRK